MKRFAVRSMLVALATVVAGAGFVEASAPGRRESSRRSSTKTVTEADTEAALVGDPAGTQGAARGHAESNVVTVTTATATTTKACLTIGVKGLTGLEGQTVTFQLSSSTSDLGTGIVKNGRATLRLNGAAVPNVNQGDIVTVVTPDGSIVSGAFGAPQTETESGS
ncbi:MAG: hypothetical protein JSS49_14370 [Planctomycetes bacterium]|nr:hypothetical protein [Planctomycetota bacterium]